MPIAFLYDYYFLTRSVHCNDIIIITRLTDHHQIEVSASGDDRCGGENDVVPSFKGEK